MKAKIMQMSNENEKGLTLFELLHFFLFILSTKSVDIE